MSASLESGIEKQMTKIEKGFTFLATVGSTAPFIGLFGTVWGIMNSFQSIAISRNTSLAIVAPGIAEALFATALGLLAAIPAVVAYNKFNNDAKKYSEKLENEIKNLEEKKSYFQKLLNERELLLKLLIEELLTLKKKYNVIRKTKVIKNINQNEELETLNNKILEDVINKKTKLYIDNRLYLKRMILSNYKKSFEVVNKIIDNKNIQKFICNIEKNTKLIGITNTGKVFNIDWESSINKEYKLDNKILGNIHPTEIINFHSISKEIIN